MSRILVLGAGVMGAAFCVPAADRGHSVALVGTHLDRDLIDGLRATGAHPRLRAPLPAGVTPFQHDELAAAFAEPPDLVICGVSTPGVDWAAARLAAYLPAGVPVALLTKGIGTDPGRIELLPEVFARGLPWAGPIGAVGGPCIAGELAVRRPTAAVIGFREGALAARWSAALATPYYQLRATDDLAGLEVCAALKNFYAIGVSTAAGRLERDPAANGAALHNMAASLFNQAVAELARLVAVAGGRPATAFGLPGLGDLHVTTQAGRNSRLGRLLGGGMTCAEALAGPLAGETVEGALVAERLGPPLAALAARGELDQADVPLARAIVAAVVTGAPLEPDLSGFHLDGA